MNRQRGTKPAVIALAGSFRAARASAGNAPEIERTACDQLLKPMGGLSRQKTLAFALGVP
jgi:hypothetical protein